MARTARIVATGVPHHITQRGNNRQDVFFVDNDRLFYLRILKKYAKEKGLEILGYCLMRDHVHLIAIPSYRDSLASAVGRTHFVYTQYINDLHHRSGHLWQNRFFSCPMDEEHLWNGLRYVERNPARAHLVSNAWEYPWSSASVHCGADDKTGFVSLHAWTNTMDAGAWKRLLSTPQDDVELKALRKSTLTGRPLGGDSFVDKLEVLTGRRLRVRPVGRPKQRN